MYNTDMGSLQLVSFESLYYIIIFIAPGFVMYRIVKSVSPSTTEDSEEHYIKCIIYSVINYFVLLVINKLLFNDNNLYKILQLDNEVSICVILGFLISYLSSMIILGIIIAEIDRIRIWDKLAKFLKLNSNLKNDTSWDYLFSNIDDETKVIIHLNNGEIIHGSFNYKSFASSKSDERDIYIDEVYDPSWNLPNVRKSLYIKGEYIKSIEIVREDKDGKED